MLAPHYDEEAVASAQGVLSGWPPGVDAVAFEWS